MSGEHEIPWSRGSTDDPYTQDDVEAVLDSETDIVIPDVNE